MERMYNFINARWNPLGGECPHACTYCYVNQFRMRFKSNKKYVGEPRLIESEFKNLGKGKTIFVCSMIDLFAEDIKFMDILTVLNWCKKFDNTYFFQTKNPKRFKEFEGLFPEKSIKCVTVESCFSYNPVVNFEAKVNVPSQFDRLADIIKYQIPVNQITIEPILDFDVRQFAGYLKQTHPDQINIGADSGGNGLPEPSKEKVLQLISELEKFTKVYQKPTLKRLLQ